MFDFIFHFRYNKNRNIIEWCHEDEMIWRPMVDELYQIISDIFLKHKNIIISACTVEYFMTRYLDGSLKSQNRNINKQEG